MTFYHQKTPQDVATERAHKDIAEYLQGCKYRWK